MTTRQAGDCCCDDGNHLGVFVTGPGGPHPGVKFYTWGNKTDTPPRDGCSPERVKVYGSVFNGELAMPTHTVTDSFGTHDQYDYGYVKLIYTGYSPWGFGGSIGLSFVSYIEWPDEISNGEWPGRIVLEGEPGFTEGVGVVRNQEQDPAGMYNDKVFIDPVPTMPPPPGWFPPNIPIPDYRPQAAQLAENQPLLKGMIDKLIQYRAGIKMYSIKGGTPIAWTSDGKNVIAAIAKVGNTEYVRFGFITGLVGGNTGSGLLISPVSSTNFVNGNLWYSLYHTSV